MSNEAKKLEVANNTINTLQREIDKLKSKNEQLISILDINELVINMQSSLQYIVDTDPKDVSCDPDELAECKKLLTKAINTLNFIEETF
jgi:hypothetical protein